MHYLGLQLMIPCLSHKTLAMHKRISQDMQFVLANHSMDGALVLYVGFWVYSPAQKGHPASWCM